MGMVVRLKPKAAIQATLQRFISDQKSVFDISR